MPKSKEKKEKTLEELRQLYDRVEELEMEDGRSLHFSEQVKSDVEEIVHNELHKRVNNWGDICKKAFKCSFYTYDDIADLLHVTRRPIKDQEKRYGENSIDPFYLEAFSLIYRKNPYDLLGIENPHWVSPPFLRNDSRKDDSAKHCNVIMTSLYDKYDPQKCAHLKTLTQIGKLSSSAFSDLHTFLKNTKMFCDVFKHDPLKDFSSRLVKWNLTCLFQPLSQDQYGSDEYQKRRVFWEARMVFENLRNYAPKRLKILAQLALCDPARLNILKNIVLDAGYPKDPKSLKEYDVDTILLKNYKPSENRRTISVDKVF